MRFGYCVRCKSKRSSKWHTARENWIDFCVAPEEQQPGHQRKNKVCNNCYHRLKDEKVDPLVKEFGDRSDKPAPKIKRSKLSGYGKYAHITLFIIILIAILNVCSTKYSENRSFCIKRL
jgi:hypothetical protein